MNWWWVSLAVVDDILVYVWHGWRWSLLLKPIADIPMMRSVRAVYVGLFANESSPAAGRRSDPLLFASPLERTCHSP
jgi:glycosyltransferase 2 family protein